MTDSSGSSPTGHTLDADSEKTSGLVAFADCELIGINKELMLVINRQNGNQLVLTPGVVEGLKSCTHFKTIETHAAQLANTQEDLKGREPMAIAALNNLKASGMLLDASEVCANLAHSVPRKLPPTRAFIITCDRPAAVQRLLDSLLRTGKLSQHNALFLVDDSRESVNQAANREAVARFNLRSAKEMFYVGAEVQQSLLSGLSDALPEHAEGIHFLLDSSLWQDSKTYGRPRTLCLLLSVGYRALVMDDDILCQAILPPIRQEGIGIGSGALRQAAFYANEQEMFSAGKIADFDPLSGHARFLGSTLGYALQTLNDGPLQPAQLLDTKAAMANVLTADSPVLVTQSGTLGDPGTGSAHWALYQDEASLERLVAAQHGIANAIDNRLNWLGSARPNVYMMPFMSQLTGLDNSYLLPPYFPAFRGEDVLFGAMLSAVQPDAVALEYPWSVPHLPVDSRTFRVQDPIIVSGGTALYARYLTEQIDYQDTTSPEHNLKFLAQDLRRIAGRLDRDLLLDFRRELAKVQVSNFQILQQQLTRTKKYNSPELEAHLLRGMDELRQQITSKNSPTGIQGVPAGATEAELLARFRSMAGGFASALEGWVEMRRVASGLGEELIRARAMLPG